MIGVLLGLLAGLLMGSSWAGYLFLAAAGFVLDRALRLWRARSAAVSDRETRTQELLYTALADHPWRSRSERNRVVADLAHHIDDTVDLASPGHATELARFVADLRGRFEIPNPRMSEFLDVLGIPIGERHEFLAEDEQTEAFRILGLPEDADEEDIQRTYRLLATQFHPDMNSSLDPERRRQADEAFLKIRDAVDRVKPKDALP